MYLRTADLPQFVARSDSLGGPGAPACIDYWAGFQYHPDTPVDQSLDPFSEAYVDQQLALYREMSGRELDQLVNEHTQLDVGRHAASINPYDHLSPAGVAEHIERLSRAIRFAAPPRGSRMLDMGCGWGLSSEVAAYCGLSVVGVDVNPDFVELVNRRAARLNHDIRAQQGTFDTFESDERFATILFYECFHHALRPWDLLGRMARHLAPDGRIVLAGEPVNDFWWTHWGMRLDPLSVYCIHKFGWLENGWSLDFLTACFHRAGLAVTVASHAEGEIGFTVLGSRTVIGRVGANEVGRSWEHSGWTVEAGYMTCLGASELLVPAPPESRIVRFGLRNFRQTPLRVTIASDDGLLIERDLIPDLNEVELTVAEASKRLRFTGEIWIPDTEVGNGDRRRISFHLEDVTFT